MASGDYYQIIDRQSLLGQECLNVYVVQATGDGATAVNIAPLWIAQVTVNWASIQSIQISHNVLEITNFADPTDWINDFTITPGAISGDCLPPFAAYSLFYQRSSRESHNGWKRVAGVPESEQANGTLTTPGLAAVQGMATILKGPIVQADPAISLIPIIWRRPRITPPRAQAFFGVADIVGSPQVTTQNTRKFGRGV